MTLEDREEFSIAVEWPHDLAAFPPGPTRSLLMFNGLIFYLLLHFICLLLLLLKDERDLNGIWK